MTPNNEYSFIGPHYRIKTVFTNIITEDFNKDNYKSSDLEDNYSPENINTPSGANMILDNNNIE